MTQAFVVTLSFLSALGACLVGGIFFAFSTFVMRGLGRVLPEQGIAAMQSINVTVINPWFFAVFFGTGAVSLVLAVLTIVNWDEPGAAILLAGAALYLIGSIGVTISFNVPLNQALAAVAPDSGAGAELWARYLSSWTAWNHVRTAACLLAATSFVLAVR